MSKLASWMHPDPAEPLTQVWLAAIWMGSVVNYPLWLQLLSLPEMAGIGGSFVIVALIGLVTLATGALLSLLAWPRLGRAVLTITLVTAAALTYFIDKYGVVVDPTLVKGVAEGGVREAGDLVSIGLLFAILVLGVGPASWLLIQSRPPAQRFGRRMARNLTSFGLASIAAGVLALALFSGPLSMRRDHAQLGYMVTPLNAVYSTGVALLGRADPVEPTFVVGTMRNCCRVHRSPNLLCCCWMPARRHVP